MFYSFHKGKSTTLACLQTQDCLICYNDRHFLQQDLQCAYMGILHIHFEYICKHPSE